MNSEVSVGTELRLDLADCDERTLDDPAEIEHTALAACAKLEVEVLRVARHRFSPQGVSVVAILAESHLAVHTWPEHGAATVDIFTCGEVDPLHVIELFMTAFSAGSSRQVRHERIPVQRDEGVRHYPDFPEYVLRPVPFAGRFPVPRFRRGIGRRFILEPEAIAWQDFFCGDAYAPPEGRDILLLHPCTWAKPYDFSAQVTRLRVITDGFPRVHRVILSNVGLVPQEYQTNPFFCSYDYAPADRKYRTDEQRQARQDFESVTRGRVEHYLSARRADYRAVIILSHRLPGGIWQTVAQAARELGLPGLVVPRASTLRGLRADSGAIADTDEWLFAQASMTDVDDGLRRLHEAMERVSA